MQTTIQAENLVVALGTLIVALLSSCGDLREAAIVWNVRGGIVIATETGVLQEYSLRTDVEWKAMPVDAVNFGEDNWIQHPPTGVFLPTGTRVTILNWRFLQGGQLIEPYSANSYDMKRNGAVEVLYIQVKDGPHRQTKGWLPHYSARRTVVLP